MDDLLGLAGLPIRIVDHGLVLDGSLRSRRPPSGACPSSRPSPRIRPRRAATRSNTGRTTAWPPRPTSPGSVPFRCGTSSPRWPTDRSGASGPVARPRPRRWVSRSLRSARRDRGVPRPGPAAWTTRHLRVARHRPSWGRIVLPPILHHATISLAGDPLVFSDVIDRRSAGEYATIAAARGLAWFIGVDGTASPNPYYTSVPPLHRLDASDWSGASEGPLYRALVDDPSAFDWLGDPQLYRARFPALAARIEPVLALLPGDP